MEEHKPAENTATQATNPPPETTQTLNSQTPQVQAQAQVHAAQGSMKRLLDSNVQIQDSSYYKMRLVLKDLRPHFIEVLHTPDFRNCKASQEIKERIKYLMELYKQMTAETVSVKKPMGADDQQPQDGIISKPSENKLVQTTTVSKKEQPVDGDGSCIIGGSAFGWNFITFSGSQPVYYGVTKESFRSSQVNLE